MAMYIKMPRLGLTMTEGVLAKWLKNEGDHVNQGDVIAEIESDKSVVSYESPESGIILKLLINEGDSIPVAGDIAIIGQPGEVVATEDHEPGMQVKEIISESEKIVISPAAKRLAKEHNIDLENTDLKLWGKRIESKDVMAILEQNKVKITPLAQKKAQANSIDTKKIFVKEGSRIFSKDLNLVRNDLSIENPADDLKMQVTGIRKVVADRMKNSLNIAAHITLALEVDMLNAIAVRDRIKDQVMKKYKVTPSINDIIVKCTAMALKDNPRINCSFTENEITIKKEINIGIAVALDEGLIVPVIKNADGKSIGEIAFESKLLANKARNGELMPDEYSGGTFTISSLAGFGITQCTSIINQPESAILSVGKAVYQPVVVDNEIVIRPIMNLTLNYDHRPIDGSKGAAFLNSIKKFLEEPYELLV